MRTKREAQKLARELRATHRLGRQWKLQLWENLGWHFDFTNGYLQLSVSEWRGGSLNWLAGVLCRLGESGFSPNSYTHGRTARAALRNLKKQCDEQIRGMAQLAAYKV